MFFATEWPLIIDAHRIVGENYALIRCFAVNERRMMLRIML